MKAKVKLSAVVDAMDMQSDETHQYLHIPTGELRAVSDEEFSYAEEDEPLDDLPDWQKEVVEVAQKVLQTDEYIQLPDKYEIHEYQIMERFCLSIEDDEMRNDMYNAIKGRGAFRMFKDKIHYYGIEQDWYRYRDDTFYEIAREWCEYNEIPHIDDRDKQEN
jgi:hypothetical protein